jgi:hypothetical protein
MPLSGFDRKPGKKMASSSSSLVLGFVARLPPASFAPFFDSLRQSGYQGRLGLVVAGYGPTELDEFRSLADWIWPVDGAYRQADAPAVLPLLRWMRTARGFHHLYPRAYIAAASLGRERRSLERWRNLEFHLEGLIGLRSSHYYDIVREMTDADAVLLTDVRDVLFQDDPFTLPVKQLEAFEEDPGNLIATQPFNRKWIKDLYGPGVLRRLGGETVSCAGTVFGPRAEILHYLSEMHAATIWRRRVANGSDQGIHNYLLRTGRLDPVAVISNGHGRVLTLGAMREIDRDADGYVLNADGSRPAVLHQYDRHGPLAAELVRLLAGERASLGSAAEQQAGG